MRSPTMLAGSRPSRCSACTPCPARTSTYTSCARPRGKEDRGVAADSVRVAAHAKINVFLRILARERDGFHQIETAFALLELADDLVVRRTATGATLDVRDEGGGADLGPPDE